MRSIKEAILAWPLLALLLLADAVFISLHVWYWSMGWLETSHQFDLEWGTGAPEYYTYFKWLICSVAALWLFARNRDLVYLAWAALFFWFLVDDAENMRTTGGAWIAGVMDWGPAWGLPAQGVGELVVSGIAGILLLGGIAVAYWRSPDAEAKAFSKALAPWLGALIVFGVGVDTLHAVVAHRTGLSAFLAVVEEGGEMIVASILTAIVCLYALPATRRGTLTARSSR